MISCRCRYKKSKLISADVWMIDSLAHDDAGEGEATDSSSAAGGDCSSPFSSLTSFSPPPIEGETGAASEEEEEDDSADAGAAEEEEDEEEEEEDCSSALFATAPVASLELPFAAAAIPSAPLAPAASTAAALSFALLIFPAVVCSFCICMIHSIFSSELFALKYSVVVCPDRLNPVLCNCTCMASGERGAGAESIVASCSAYVACGCFLALSSNKCRKPEEVNTACMGFQFDLINAP